MSKESTRVTLYFSETDSKLLEFVNSQKSKRSTFIMSLIEKAYDEQSGKSEVSNNEILDEIKKQNELSNQKLLDELKKFVMENSLQIAGQPAEQPAEEVAEEEEPNIDFSQVPYENANNFTF